MRLRVGERASVSGRPAAPWTAVVPIKALRASKTRLARSLPAAVRPAVHAELVRAMQEDTLAAVRSCPAVARVVVVVDVPSDTLQLDSELITLVQRSAGLNGALRDGARYAARQWPTSGVVAVVGDLPTLTPQALQHVLDRASGVPHGFVPDAAGTGTTILTARPGTLLRPRFGLGSAGLHADGAIRLPADDAARRDVDTMSDLRDAVRLGLGRATSAALRAADTGAAFIRTGHDVGYEPADRGDRNNDASRGQRSGG